MKNPAFPKSAAPANRKLAAGSPSKLYDSIVDLMASSSSCSGGTWPMSARAHTNSAGSARKPAATEALLFRLADLEETVTVQRVSEDRLKGVNIELMRKLRAFQQTNEANVMQAESELTRLHQALQAERVARTEAEAAAAASGRLLAEERNTSTTTAGQVLSEKLRAGETSEQLRALLQQISADTRMKVLGQTALSRKWLLLLRQRTQRQRAIRESVFFGELLSCTARSLLWRCFTAWLQCCIACRMARRVFSTDAMRSKQTVLRALRLAVRHSRNLAETAHERLAARGGFQQWRAAVFGSQSKGGFEIMVEHARLARGVAALRDGALRAATLRLAAAAAARWSGKRSRSQAIAALRCWAVVSGTELRRRATSVSAELQVRNELLAQARAASAAVEAENEDLRVRVASLDTDKSALQEELTKYRNEAAAVSESLATLERRFAAEETTRQETEARLADARADGDHARQQLALERDHLEEMRNSHALALQQASERAEELEGEIGERDHLLASSQAALQQVSQQVQSMAADGDSKLRAAVEVAASLRSMLTQRDAAVKVAASRERRQARTIRQLDTNVKGLQTQVVGMRAAESHAEDSRLKAKQVARREEGGTKKIDENGARMTNAASASRAAQHRTSNANPPLPKPDVADAMVQIRALQSELRGGVASRPRRSPSAPPTARSPRAHSKSPSAGTRRGGEGGDGTMQSAPFPLVTGCCSATFDEASHALTGKMLALASSVKCKLPASAPTAEKSQSLSAAPRFPTRGTHASDHAKLMPHVAADAVGSVATAVGGVPAIGGAADAAIVAGGSYAAASGASAAVAKGTAHVVCAPACLASTRRRDEPRSADKNTAPGPLFGPKDARTKAVRSGGGSLASRQGHYEQQLRAHIQAGPNANGAQPAKATTTPKQGPNDSRSNRKTAAAARASDAPCPSAERCLGTAPDAPPSGTSPVRIDTGSDLLERRAPLLTCTPPVERCIPFGCWNR